MTFQVSPPSAAHLRYAPQPGATTPLGMMAATSQTDRPWAACRRPVSFSHITANGTMLACCFVPFVTPDYPAMPDLVLGNAFAEPFAAIWDRSTPSGPQRCGNWGCAK